MKIKDMHPITVAITDVGGSPAESAPIISLIFPYANTIDWMVRRGVQAAVDAETKPLIKALKRIATLHVTYEENRKNEVPGDSGYGIGVTDGHRCAAKVARIALMPFEEPEEK